jgi:diguanylate cyclase (GGDEF)-like protein
MGQAVERCQPIVITDYASWSEQSPKYEGLPIYAALAMPLMIGGRMLGVIGVFHSDQFYSFNNSELNLLTLFGQQAAIAVENARLFSETRRLAQVDSLTGLFNRRHFYELARREFERARRYQLPLTAIMVDVDNFKLVNDRYGHSVGDMVLHSVAQSCLTYLRSADLVARYGGEEFVVLVPNTDLDGCRTTAERMRACVANRPHSVGEDHLSITISLGIAEMDPGCLSIDTLLDQADKALYLAKQAGKNRVATWPKE